MSPADELELKRLSDLLASVHGLLPESSLVREALQKAAFALQLTFLKGSRSEID